MKQKTAAIKFLKECTQIKEKGADAEKPESFNIVIKMTRCNFLAKQKLRINKILIIN